MPKLYSLSDDKDVIYVITENEEPAHIRRFCEYNDHGGMNNDDFYRIARTGTLKRIKSLEEVSVEDRNIIPYITDERLPNGEFLDYDGTIEDFFCENVPFSVLDCGLSQMLTCEYCGGSVLEGHEVIADKYCSYTCHVLAREDHAAKQLEGKDSRGNAP